MDESNATCGKRLASIGLENTEANRQAYRTLLITVPGLGQYISSAILFEETLYQSTTDGKKMVDVLVEQGIVPGVKVDKDNGLVPIVEPEILLDSEHGIERTFEIAQKVWAEVFFYLAENNVMFEGILLKPGMVTPGAECKDKATPQQVAEYTLKLLGRRSPPSRPWNHVFVWWTTRSGSNLELECHEPVSQSVACIVLVRSGPSEHLSEDVGWLPGEREGSSGGFAPQGQVQLSCSAWEVHC
ncbi:unnamed protein product [Ilex paraguariensis]|uniref:fructose-bisphosphate aldolase n=1 Tax=Ilex paraguariensis TaxID=185542 RepID=A0ABC8SXW1_9AQUA